MQAGLLGGCWDGAYGLDIREREKCPNRSLPNLDALASARPCLPVVSAGPLPQGCSTFPRKTQGLLPQAWLERPLRSAVALNQLKVRAGHRRDANQLALPAAATRIPGRPETDGQVPSTQLTHLAWALTWWGQTSRCLLDWGPSEGCLPTTSHLLPDLPPKNRCHPFV